MIRGACCVFNAFLIERGIKDLTAISDALVGEFLAAYRPTSGALARIAGR